MNSGAELGGIFIVSEVTVRAYLQVINIGDTGL